MALRRARLDGVFAEYGNVGIKFAYIATEGFDWCHIVISYERASWEPEMAAGSGWEAVAKVGFF